MSSHESAPLRVAVVQTAPVLLDRDRTLSRVVQQVTEAGARGARLVCFGEALVPSYPVWIERTDGARFDSADQKRLHALYMKEAVQIEAGHLDPLREAARAAGAAVVLGVVERPADRGGHSLYCTRVFVDAEGELASVHRKLMPTYEERLTWSPGDGAGLVTHPVGAFRVGALLCWENWMPLARAALYAAGENLHVSLWPGGDHNTRDLVRFIARESRSYCIGACGILRGRDVPADVPFRDRIAPADDELILNGGSCIAGPDGEWIAEPVVGREDVLFADLDPTRVLEERQNFDPSGHYSRPDVLSLRVDRRRQGVVEWVGEGDPPAR